MTFSLCIIEPIPGCHTFVGSIPTALCTEIEATTTDVMGGRAHQAADGRLLTWKVPAFPSRAAAAAHCQARGIAAPAA